MTNYFKIILSILTLIITSVFPTNLSAENNLKKFSLENGLTCILDKKGPSGLVAISLRVASGSAREEKMLGYGISHLIEHMAFKSCKGYPLGMVEKTIRQIGARMNATTSYDTTDFFMTIPKENLQAALDLLTNMTFFPSYDSQELKSEKDVVHKEIILRRDRPSTKLHDLLYKTAYLEHPYRHPIIGYDDLLKSITKEEIESYHKKAYQPGNMVLAIVGDIDLTQTEQLIKLYFSQLKNTAYFKLPPPQEPQQLSPRASTAYSDINLSETSIAFLSTELLNPDLYRLDLLAAILGRGDASLLNTVLVKEKQLVQSVSCYNYTPKDRGLFVINFISRPEKIDQAITTILGQIDKIKIKPFSKADLNRAKKMIASDLIYQQESLSAIASSLTSSEAMTGDYTFEDKYIEEINRVTAKDISSAAKKYLNRKKVTTANLLPNSYKEKDLNGSKPASSSKPEIQTKTLKNKIRSISIRNDLTPTAAITIIVGTGLKTETKENNGISNILSEMLLKGTPRHKEWEIKSQFESRGAEISSFQGPDSLGITIRFLKDDLKFALEMLYELLEFSVFPDQEFEKLKALTLLNIEKEKESIFFNGIRKVKQTLYQEHPYSRPNLGTSESVTKLRRKDLLDFYQETIDPQNMVIVVSGDIDPKETNQLIEKIFSPIKPKESSPTADSSALTPLEQSLRYDLSMNREQALSLLAFPGIKETDEEKYPFEVLESIMSGSDGRLFHSIRNKLAISYTQDFFISNRINGGFFGGYVLTSPENLKQAEKALKQEFERLSSGLSQDEIDLAIHELISKHRMDMQGNLFIATSCAQEELLIPDGYKNVFDYEKKIKAVTSEKIVEVISKYINNKKLVTITVSP